MRKILALLVLLFVSVPFLTAEVVAGGSEAEETARLKLLLDSPKNTSAYLHALRVFADAGDKTIVPKVIENIKELLETIKPVPVPVEAPKVEETEGEEVKQEKPVEKEKKAAEPRDKKNKNLRTGLKDNDKAQAVDTIEELVSVLADVKDDSKEVKGLLVKLLDERLDLRLGRIALYALGELKIKGLFREQLGILQDETNYTYRRELIWAFSKGGVKEIEPVLFKFLPDETPSVRGVIALSLFNLKARNFGFQFLEEAKYEQNSWVKEKYEWVGKKLTN